MWAVLVSILIVGWLWRLWSCYRRPKGTFPGGPLSLPIVGSVPFVTRKFGDPLLHVRLSELAKTYGDVYSLNVGGKWFVVLNSYSTIKEAMNNPCFGGKMRTYLVEEYHRSRNIPMFTGADYSAEFRLQKETITRILKTIGIQDSVVATKIERESQRLVNFWKSKNGQPFYPRIDMFTSNINIQAGLLFNEDFEYGDRHLVSIRKWMDDMMEGLYEGMYFEYIPHCLQNLPVIRNPKDKIFQSQDRLLNFIQDKVDQNKNGHLGSKSPNFISEYLQMASANPALTENYSAEKWVSCLTLAFFIAGSINMTNIPLFFMMYMILYPSTQYRIQREMCQNLGGRMPRFSDLEQLPYLHAVILEVMRIQHVAPLGAIRNTLQDVKLGEFFLPKDTAVVTNLWALFHDDRVWSEPDRFQPEQFLGSDGKSVVTPKEWIPLPGGVRGCFNMSLAMKEIFTYCATIVYEFTVHSPEGSPLPDTRGVFKVAYGPKDFDVVLRERTAKTCQENPQ